MIDYSKMRCYEVITYYVLGSSRPLYALRDARTGETDSPYSNSRNCLNEIKRRVRLEQKGQSGQ